MTRTVQEMHVLLDHYIDALAQAGHKVDLSAMGGPRTEREVRDALDTAGFVADDDVVGWFTWSAFNGYPHLFWETGFPQTLQGSIDWNHQFDPDPTFWPGPSSWLSVLYLDVKEFMSVDLSGGPNHGSVFFLFATTESTLLFDSLGEAIETALYAIESGLWTISDDRVECEERSVAPGENDRDQPPWAGYHGPFSWTLARHRIPDNRVAYVNDTGAERLLCIPSESRSRALAPPVTPTPVPWKEVAQHRRSDPVDLEAGLAAGRWRPVMIEPGSDPLAIVRKSSTRHPRCQLLSVDCPNDSWP